MAKNLIEVKPQRIENFFFASRVKQMVGEPIDRDAVIALGAEIARKMLGGVYFFQGLLKYLDICYTMDRIKCSVMGKGPSAVASTLNYTVCYAFVSELRTVSEDDLSVTQGLMDRFRHGEKGQQWFVPKLIALETALMNRLRVREFIATAVRPVENIIRESGDAIERLDGMSVLVMDVMRGYRKYGIKPSFFCDGEFQSQDQAWVIDPHPTPEHDVLDDHPAWLALAKRRDICGTLLRGKREKGIGFETYILERGYPLDLLLSIDHDGELRFSRADQGIVRQEFRSAGLEAGYSFLRLGSLLKLFDLTVPIYVSRDMPAGPAGGLLELAKHPDGLAEIERILVLPRIRSIGDDPSGAASLFEREFDEDEVETKRRMRKHDCEAHVRRLPPGHRASPEALILAEEAGLPLSENETFVRKHERGVGEKLTTPHRALPR